MIKENAEKSKRQPKARNQMTTLLESNSRNIFARGERLMHVQGVQNEFAIRMATIQVQIRYRPLKVNSKLFPLEFHILDLCICSRKKFSFFKTNYHKHFSVYCLCPWESLFHLVMRCVHMNKMSSFECLNTE